MTTEQANAPPARVLLRRRVRLSLLSFPQTRGSGAPSDAPSKVSAPLPVRRAKPLGAGGVLAMKKYGLVLADNGSAWYFQGTADTRWPNALLDQLKRVPASAFEAVDTSSLMISPNSMQVDAPP
jgi:hypothetical protein